MKGYEILNEVRTLTPEQLDYFLQHLLGKMSMDFEGFTDSTARPEYAYSKYVFDNMDDSLTRARLGEIARPLPVCDKHGVHMTNICQLCAHLEVVDTSTHCPKHGCNLATRPTPGHENHVDCGQTVRYCPRCEHEADHPPIEPKGAEDLSPEQLQQLHRQQLVTTSDSIENIDPSVVQSATHYTPSPAVVELVKENAPDWLKSEIKQQVWHTACHDCGNIVYPLDGTKRLAAHTGVMCDDKLIRCGHCHKKLIEPQPIKPTEQIMIDGLKVSTDTLAYHLIPVIAIQRLCERIMLGEETKGKDAWNALSDNQAVLDSKKALARRFGHTINHAYRLLGKIQRGESWTEEDEKEASAVMWGGMYAITAINRQRKNQSVNSQANANVQGSTD